jgi:fucose permease
MVYCAIELSIGLWASSYFVYSKGITVATAATLVGVYYFGITFGRVGFGVLSFKINNHTSVLIGAVMTVVMLVILAFANVIWIYYGVLFLIGVGLAPIFPGLTHETPTRFTKQYTPHIIGYQIAFANIGLSIFPAIFGLIVRGFNVSLLPVFLIVLGLMMLGFIVILDQMFTHKKNTV